MSVSKASVELPILDISQPLSPSSLSLLADACRKWGFFHIKNHGISKDIYNKLHSFSNEIFSLPSETKLKIGPLSSLNTYTPHFIASPFFETLRVSGPNFLASAQSSADSLFNQKSPHQFSEILQEYGDKMTELSRKIIKNILMSLGEGFDTKYHESHFKNCHGYLRINNYTPPETLGEDEEPEGLGMHTDMSCVTIVYQDQTGGLQVKSSAGDWVDIAPCDESESESESDSEALVVNIGDLLQAWSNDRLRSSEHRVVLRRPAINRFSIAFFWGFEDEKVVSAPEEVVGDGGKRLYKPFVCSDYLKFRENDERGKFEKVGFTVRDFAGNAITKDFEEQ
ncbi:Gibberellin 20-oxidase-like protein, partial [Cucurbita argyrosperma subsp. argyrosperma]